MAIFANVEQGNTFEEKEQNEKSGHIGWPGE